MRNTIIFINYRKIQRLWRFLFTGFGVIFVSILVISAIFTKQIFWTPIKEFNIKDISIYKFKMTDINFVGKDKDGQDFEIKAEKGFQTYKNQNIVFLEDIIAKKVRLKNGNFIKDTIKSDFARYKLEKKEIIFYGNVFFSSSDGTKLITKELIVKL